MIMKLDMFSYKCFSKYQWFHGNFGLFQANCILLFCYEWGPHTVVQKVCLCHYVFILKLKHIFSITILISIPCHGWQLPYNSHMWPKAVHTIPTRDCHWRFACILLSPITHWGRVMHICHSKLIIIGSDNVLSPGRCQAIIWTNAGILLIRALGTNVSEILERN